MNVVGMIFAGIIMFALIFFGLGASQTLVDSANITANDTFYSEYNTSINTATATFNFMGYIPYLIFITALFAVLIILAKLV